MTERIDAINTADGLNRSMTPTICIAPRWGAGPDDAWYPWLKRQLRGCRVMVSRLLPSPRSPEAGPSVAAVRERVGSDPDRLAHTVLVGHSVGCHVNLRFLETLPEGIAIAGVLCVAGWWHLDDPRPGVRAWTEPHYDRAKVRAAANRLVTLLSDDDPHTTDQERNRAAWRRHFDADVQMVAGRGHFGHTREPAVLAAVRQLIAPVGG